jgi:hypothetical protein
VAQHDDCCYVLFVDDPTEGLENHEYEVTASSVENAYSLGQEAFPYGIIRAVVTRAELDEGDAWGARATKKRAAEDERLRRAWGSTFEPLLKPNDRGGGPETIRPDLGLRFDTRK